MQLKLEPFDEAPPGSEPAQRMSCFTATLNLSCSSKNSDALGLRKERPRIQDSQTFQAHSFQGFRVDFQEVFISCYQIVRSCGHTAFENHIVFFIPTD